jgi:hypothetical protein
METYKVEIKYKVRHVFEVEADSKPDAKYKADLIIDDMFKYAANKCDTLMSEYTIKVI